MPLATGAITITDVNDDAILSIETPDGITFQGNSGNPKWIYVKLRRAGEDVTSLATIQWYLNGTITDSLANKDRLQVSPADVPSQLIVKIVATLNGVSYQNAITMFDLDDTYRVDIIGNDSIRTSGENAVLTAKVYRGATEVTAGFRCRWTDISGQTPVVLYTGINTTGTLAERGVTLTLTPAQINKQKDLLCELSVDTVEQELDLTEVTYTPSYNSKTYSTAMSIALS